MAQGSPEPAGPSSPSPQPSQRTPALTNSSSILGFIRGRPRATSISADAARDESSPEPTSGRHRSPHTHLPTSTSQQHQHSSTEGHSVFTGMLRRRRSQNNINTSNNHATNPAPSSPALLPPPPFPSAAPPTNMPASVSQPNPTTPGQPPANTHRIRLVPHLDSRRNLKFDPIVRNLKPGDDPLKIGRFTDRSGLGVTAQANANKLAFKSKVVSRNHAEISIEAAMSGNQEVKFFVKDTKSSSGTFLNHLRLSPAGQESRKFELRDGDLLQLGVDYQGGTEDIYKSVKIRVEVGAGREWQAGRNAFNTNALRNLRSLAGGQAGETPPPPQNTTPTEEGEKKKVPPKTKSTIKSTPIAGIPDCCICLFAVQIRQALFIAPCSHTFHYKCIRPLLEQHHPSFSCPLCRTYADLEEDVEVDEEVEEEEEADAVLDPVSHTHDEGADEDEEMQDALLATSALVTSHNGAGNGRGVSSRAAGAETDVEDFAPLLVGAALGGGTLINANGGGRRLPTVASEESPESSADERHIEQEEAERTRMVVD